MPKSLLRIVALILVPCLMADPALAGISFQSQPVMTSSTQVVFQAEAMELQIRFQQHVINRFHRLFSETRGPIEAARNHLADKGAFARAAALAISLFLVAVPGFAKPHRFERSTHSAIAGQWTHDLPLGSDIEGIARDILEANGLPLSQLERVIRDILAVNPGITNRDVIGQGARILIPAKYLVPGVDTESTSTPMEVSVQTKPDTSSPSSWRRYWIHLFWTLPLLILIGLGLRKWHQRYLEWKLGSKRWRVRIKVEDLPKDLKDFDAYAASTKMARNFVRSVDPEDLADVLARASGLKDLTANDLTGDLEIGYFNQGSHKQVFTVAADLKNAPPITLLLASKMEHVPNDIAENEKSDLKKLDGHGVPIFGKDYVSDDGLEWYTEEFIEGPTAFDLRERGQLNTYLRKSIIKTLLGIGLALGGWVPRDLHLKNFVFRDPGAEAVMVDIGNRRLHALGAQAIPRHQVLLLSLMSVHYSATRGPPGYDDIFDGIIETLGEDAGRQFLRSVLATMDEMDPDALVKYLFKEGRQNFWSLGATKKNLQPLADFTSTLHQSLDTYLRLPRTPSTTPKPPEPPTRPGDVGQRYTNRGWGERSMRNPLDPFGDRSRPAYRHGPDAHRQVRRVDGPQEGDKFRQMPADSGHMSHEALVALVHQELPAEFYSILEIPNLPLAAHHEGPKHGDHLLALFHALESLKTNPAIPDRYRQLLANPHEKTFFTRFILLHDLGKTTVTPSTIVKEGRTVELYAGHEEESFRLAMEHPAIQQLVSTTPHPDALLAAIRLHGALYRVSREPMTADQFETFIRENNIPINQVDEIIPRLIAACLIDDYGAHQSDSGFERSLNFAKGYEEYRRLHPAVAPTVADTTPFDLEGLYAKLEENWRGIRAGQNLVAPENEAQLARMSRMFPDGRPIETDLWGVNLEDLPDSFVQFMETIAREWLGLLPAGTRSYEIKPSQYHISLALAQDLAKNPEEGQGILGDPANRLSPEEIQKILKETSDILQETPGPIRLRPRGVRIGPDGTLIFVFEDSSPVQSLRQALRAGFEKVTPKAWQRPKPMIHITLYRPLENIHVDEAMAKAIQSFGDRYLDVRSHAQDIEISRVHVSHETRWMHEAKDYDMAVDLKMPTEPSSTGGVKDGGLAVMVGVWVAGWLVAHVGWIGAGVVGVVLYKIWTSKTVLRWLSFPKSRRTRVAEAA